MADKLYHNKNILAPMVRIGTLPTRLLALRYGADYVYSEEIIDHKMLQTRRVVNSSLGTIDYVLSDNSLVFRTCDSEKDYVVFQMGTCDPSRALKVAKKVEKDVCAIDVNMGCPKKFSVDSGMGAALLDKPDLICDILKTLVNGVSIPVTCKIRILPELEDTLKLLRVIETTGVRALAVHGRTRDERPRHDNHDNIIKSISDQAVVPIIANGGSKDIASHADLVAFRQRTGADSVMVARAAEWNTSVFRKEGTLPIDDVIKNLFHEQLSTERGKELYAAANLRDVCAIWNLERYYDEVTSKRAVNCTLFKKRCLENGMELYQRDMRFNKKEYVKKTPKVCLLELSRKDHKNQPVYVTEETCDRAFRCVLEYDGRKYSAVNCSKSKKQAEQSAAMVCLSVLDELDSDHASTS